MTAEMLDFEVLPKGSAPTEVSSAGTVVPTVRAAVAAMRPAEPPVFEPGLYPRGYAREFLRDHLELLPWPVIEAVAARHRHFALILGACDELISVWVAMSGEDEDEVLRLLADAGLAERGMVRGPAGV